MEKKIILIVDNKPDILRLAKFGLEKHGYDVLTATNGQEALDLVRDEKPDLVLMDIMPKGKTDGIKTAGKIRRPKSARAIGNALGANPLPLIIPCHRVIRADGKIGGFTATGGAQMKKRMLKLEQTVTSA